MIKKFKSALLALAMIAAVGVGAAGLVYGLSGQAQAEEIYSASTSPVWSWPPPSSNDTLLTEASSQIERDINGVWYQFNTGDLDSGVHTMWFVVFNDPDSCDGACGGPDLKAGLGNSAAFWAPGTVIGSNGEGNFGGYIEANTMPTGLDQIMIDNTGGQGLTDVEKAEIHLVLRSHGPAFNNAGFLNTQMSTFNGGCQPTPDSCKNVQFAVHSASTQ